MYSFKTEAAEILIYRKKHCNSLLTISIVVFIFFIVFKTESTAWLRWVEMLECQNVPLLMLVLSKEDWTASIPQTQLLKGKH